MLIQANNKPFQTLIYKLPPNAEQEPACFYLM